VHAVGRVGKHGIQVQLLGRGTVIEVKADL